MSYIIPHFTSLPLEFVDDAALVSAYQQSQDLDLILKLVHRHRNSLAAISHRFCTRVFTPEDALQEFILILKDKLMNLQVRSTLKGWLCTTLKNWLIDRQRKEQSHQNYCQYQRWHGPQSESSCETRLDHELLLEQIFDCLRPEEAQCIRLHYLAGYSYQEMAEQLGWSFKKVNGHIYRGIK
ncbi:MAG: sigma-70 family RNA polymerase sigma factor, partial [Bacteroidota bacterium]